MTIYEQGRHVERRPVRRPPKSGGKIRVGMILTAMYVGGAERWLTDLIAATECKTIIWVGVGLTEAIYGDVFKNRINCTIHRGEEACKKLGSKVDVLFTWTVKDATKYAAKGVAVIAVSHSPPESEWARQFWGENGVPGAVRYLAVSKTAGECLPKSVQHLVDILEPGINPVHLNQRVTRARQRAAWGIFGPNIIIGYVGRLSDEKGYKLAWQCLDHLPDHYSTVMIGDGAMIEFDRKETRRFGKRVVFNGPAWDVGSIYGAIDILVVPSDFESFGYVLAEAYQFGVPVVSTNVGEARVKKWSTVYLPDKPTPEEVALAVQEVDNNPGWEVIVKKRAEKAYSWIRYKAEVRRYIRAVHEQQCKRLGLKWEWTDNWLEKRAAYANGFKINRRGERVE